MIALLLAQTIASLSGVQTATRKSIALMDPNAPEAETAIEDGLKRGESILDTAAAGKAVSQANLARTKIDNRDGAYGETIQPHWYMHGVFA